MRASVKCFIQARMSSRRYPGKVLAPFRGEPMIRHVVRAVETALPRRDLVVVTSTHPTDDPLVHYLHAIGIQVFRGPLDNVLQRFLLCLKAHPCEWVLRINGDSPLLWPELIQLFVRRFEQFEGDLITTIFPRTFPRGQNAELISAEALRIAANEAIVPEDMEHVTPFFYCHPERFRIMNIESGNANLADASLAVDTIEDLQRLEGLPVEEIHRLSPPVFASGVVL
jgi:spore coat polysaccharide biosynthesis protein SpsF